MIYEFTSGNKFKGLDAQTVGEELERIRKQFDGLPTERVVEEAKNKASPLHTAFTWNDKIAAHNHRMDEARDLIRCVLVRETANSEPMHAFIHVRIQADTSEEEEDAPVQQYYQSVQVIATRPNEYHSAVRDSTARLLAAQRSLEELKRLAPDRKREKRVATAKRHVEQAQRALTTSA